MPEPKTCIQVVTISNVTAQARCIGPHCQCSTVFNCCCCTAISNHDIPAWHAHSLCPAAAAAAACCGTPLPPSLGIRPSHAAPPRPYRQPPHAPSAPPAAPGGRWCRCGRRPPARTTARSRASPTGAAAARAARACGSQTSHGCPTFGSACGVSGRALGASSGVAGGVNDLCSSRAGVVCR